MGDQAGTAKLLQQRSQPGAQWWGRRPQACWHPADLFANFKQLGYAPSFQQQLPSPNFLTAKTPSVDEKHWFWWYQYCLDCLEQFHGTGDGWPSKQNEIHFAGTNVRFLLESCLTFFCRTYLWGEPKSTKMVSPISGFSIGKPRFTIITSIDHQPFLTIDLFWCLAPWGNWMFQVSSRDSCEDTLAVVVPDGRVGRLVIHNMVKPISSALQLLLLLSFISGYHALVWRMNDYCSMKVIMFSHH